MEQLAVHAQPPRRATHRAVADARSGAMDPLAALQASAGNAAAARLLSRVQRTAEPGGLTVSPANDPLEREADQVADAVMRMPQAPQAIQRKCEACAKDDEERVARKPDGEDLLARGDPDPAAGPASADVASGIRARQGGGQPLPEASRAFFEPRLGYDLGGVRVHHDEGAASLASRVQASAFTVGSDIFFNRGRYTPDQPAGQRLMAHELAHVVQQGGAVQRRRLDRETQPATGATAPQTAGAPPASASAPAPDNRVKSGASWVNEFPTSRSLDDLSGSFKDNAKAFVAALRAAGATVSISATKRPAERAFLMHYAWKVAKGLIAPEAVPARVGVDINWVHDTPEASRKAAQDMVDSYDVVFQPSLTSKHIDGNAVDMKVTWTGELNIANKDGSTTSCGEPRLGADNTALHAVGATYSVNKLVSDPPHWSDDGR